MVGRKSFVVLIARSIAGFLRSKLNDLWMSHEGGGWTSGLSNGRLLVKVTGPRKLLHAEKGLLYHCWGGSEPEHDNLGKTLHSPSTVHASRKSYLCTMRNTPRQIRILGPRVQLILTQGCSANSLVSFLIARWRWSLSSSVGTNAGCDYSLCMELDLRVTCL